MNAFRIIKYPMATEKSIRMVESENKLIFIVEKTATKQEIKNAIETAFKTKVADVNVSNDIKGNKKAYVKFAKDVNALDIATNLGLL